MRHRTALVTISAIMFQFTHPGGVRLVRLARCQTIVAVSIHAPGRGATAPGADHPRRIGRFQFTHPGGVRQPIDREARWVFNVSIHAPGRGATDRAITNITNPISFNSRTREGCDGGGADALRLTQVSIHAPGRGATVWCKVAYYGADKQA